MKDDTETAHWAYSGFNRFRERVSRMAGIELYEMQGFKTDNGTPFGNMVDGRSWSSIKDPIKYLLNHSDCDGQISARRCKLVARRLMELWDADMVTPKDDYDRQQAYILIENLKNAAKNNVPLIFT